MQRSRYAPPPRLPASAARGCGVLGLACAFVGFGALPASAFPAVVLESPSIRPFAGGCASGAGMHPEISRLTYQAAVSDEFSGSRLASSRWYDTNPWWVGRDNGRFDPVRTTVAGGVLNQSVTLAGAKASRNVKYLTSAIVSKSRFLYGYFETRTISSSAGVTSSFWFYKDDPDIWTEIDVYENIGLERYAREVRSNTHIFRLPNRKDIKDIENPHVYRVNYDLSQQWTVYGLYWTPKKLEFYVNGCLTRVIRNDYFHQPIHAVYDMEIMKEHIGEPDLKSLPARYRIDYFRVWK